jgi:transcriptional regulator GlxA family with amidase domain
MPATTKTIAILVYEGVQTLDVAAPLDAFAAANDLRAASYAPVVISLDGAAITSETGLRLIPTCRLDALGEIDTLLIPGGIGLRTPHVAAAMSAAILARAEGVRRIVSVCTGIYGLAPTGLLDGLRATTHWKFAANVAAQFPKIQMESDSLFIKQGRIFTAAGVTAAIDLALALIEADYGAALALAVARDLVVYVKRAGGQRQYSEPLQFQARAVGRFGELAAWIAANLHQKLPIETLAAQVNLSPRQFSRRFADVFDTSPAQYIETLRLDAARAQLTATAAQIAQIAHAIGFASVDVFTRAFTRRFGLAPSDYRLRFTAAVGENHE